MPDGSRQARRPPPVAAPAEAAVGGIVRDPIDVRDRAYEPTLAPLAPQRMPHPPSSSRRCATRRSLGPAAAAGRGGHLRRAGAGGDDRPRAASRAQVAEPYPVSARMIYQMRAAQGRRGAGDDGVSLRDVIKAFYNYGVCREGALALRGRTARRGQLSVERARDAKNLSLGAYYRLRPNLNTYHAALHETGAILVSAELHDGWRHDRVRAARRRDRPAAARPAARGARAARSTPSSSSATRRAGFLVLNSWGRDWGGWTPGRRPARAPVPGIALWRYDDWADTIMDGWVLRLGVGAAEAFEYSIGDQGLGFGAEAPVRSTPVHAILGNFLHLDDGDFVRLGRLSSPPGARWRRRGGCSRRTPRSAKPYRGVLLTFAGGLTGLQGRDRPRRALEAAGARRALVSLHRALVRRLRRAGPRRCSRASSREAEKRAGGPGPRLDRVVEERAHGDRPGALARHRPRRRPGGARRRAAARPRPRRRGARGGAGRASGSGSSRNPRGPSRWRRCSRAMQTEAFAAEAAPFFEMLRVASTWSRRR